MSRMVYTNRKKQGQSDTFHRIITQGQERRTHQMSWGLQKLLWSLLFKTRRCNVIRGQLKVYANVEVVRMGRPRVRSLKTPTSPYTRPCVKHIKHGLGTGPVSGEHVM